MRDFIDALDAELRRAAVRPERGTGRVVTLVRRRAASLRIAAPTALAATATVALIGLVVVLALGRGAGQRPAAPTILGEYTSRVVLREGDLPDDAPARSSLEIGKETFAVASGIYGLQGTTEIEGDTIRFRSPSGFHYLPRRANTAGGLPEGSGGCFGAAATGEYRWRVAREVLTLEVVRDPCGPRARLLSGGEWAAIPGRESG